MIPHPDQLNLKEAADALGTLAGVDELATKLSHQIQRIAQLVEFRLPGVAQALVEEPQSEAATIALARVQVEAADRAAEICAAIELLTARLAKAGPALHQVLDAAEEAEFEAQKAAAIAAGFDS
ncbi:hypothetical protein [Xanthobacter flavus]|uniref:hypothetical protein n=1 Tax=Xanthobacter flavus TaxID=281 RepID=UPI001AE913A0|nr:hypothetical protein [Xanthobacter flavus]MBP2147959.1 ribosome-associated translation inhibitor RaiA [Xanthobacter flavus]